ncbi:uncharacterized protein (TIGR02284 family) [Azospirillum fermentarium]|uniref:PA2169 family four-helix-bundle protein n=1 Tax=Azospirillum fermentarium TaxID=1233114 RepID=UPI002225C917|nr:PA2169 family four-helix-bundle protein [Azospirillum fermentarium]MCW2244480.1 uncharacterized protein (TIGR02284 family) [Azospirillum fermentarium]
MIGRDQLVDALNGLIHIVEDSHEGYRQAAENAAEDGMKGLFNDVAAQRGAIVRELQRLVAEQGGAPGMGGTVTGSTLRFFLDLKQAVLGHDRTALLDGIERGETECLRLYDQTLDLDIPPEVHSTLARHRDRIGLDFGRMNGLRLTVEKAEEADQ